MVGNWKDNTSLSIDVAVIDPTCDTHAEKLASEGVGAAAAKYQARKRKTYEDIKENVFTLCNRITWRVWK